MMKTWKFLIYLIPATLLLTSCSGKAAEETAGQEVQEAGKNTEAASKEDDAAEKETKEPEILHFVDVYQNPYQVEINPNVEKLDYKDVSFFHNGDRLSYEDDSNYTYRLGVDVSEHQGYVDWQALKDSGFEFAFIRLGYRGYGQEGRICLDREFHRNIQNAQAAGFDVGVYFFAQAVNEEEALEEANFVLQNLEGYTLQLPVVYDPESILDDEARTDNVSGEQFTKNTEVFCSAVADAGYDPMIYANMLWEAFELDLEELSEYPLWYADYEPVPAVYESGADARDHGEYRFEYRDGAERIGDWQKNASPLFFLFPRICRSDLPDPLLRLIQDFRNL